MPKPGSSTARGYGYRHQQLRKALLAQAYGQPCTRCGKPLEEGQKLHLDHTDDRTGYNGFAHATCNTSAGGRKRARQQRQRKAARLRGRW